MQLQGQDGTAVWEALQEEAREKETAVYASVWSPDGQVLVAGSNFGRVNVWHMPPTRTPTPPDTVFTAHSGAVYSMCFASPQVLLTAGDDPYIRAWRWESILDTATASNTPLTHLDQLSVPHKQPVPLLEMQTPQQDPGSAGLLADRFETNGIYVDHRGGVGTINQFAFTFHFVYFSLRIVLFSLILRRVEL